MQKEIFEQPESVVNTMRGRIQFGEYEGTYESVYTEDTFAAILSFVWEYRGI